MTICCITPQASNSLYLVFYKDNDSKILKLSSIKIEEEKVKPDSSYEMFPLKTMLSMNAEFLCIIKYNGAVDLLK